MKKFLFVSALTLVVIGGAVRFLPSDVMTSLDSSVGRHTEQTMATADKKAADALAATAEDTKGVVESGKNVVEATKEAAKEIQNGDTSKGLETLDGAGSTYMTAVEKAQHDCEVYSQRLETLTEEKEAAEERWNEIIEQIKDPKLKADHQKMKDRRMRNVNRRLQSGKSNLQVLYAALNRASDTKLALASLRQDALMGSIGTKLTAFISEMKEADAGLERALAAISSSLDTNSEASAGL
jgi:predicted RNase H-like nuclease (RuvC/YqgF family)